MAETFSYAVAVFKWIYDLVHRSNIGYRCASFLKTLARRTKQFFNPVFPKLFIFEGLEKHSRLALTIAYAGSQIQMQEYWARAAFEPGYKRRKLGRRFFIGISTFLRNRYPDCNVLLTEHNGLTKFYSSKSAFYIPESVDMELDISTSMERLLGHQRENILRRIRKFGLTYELTNDLRHFDEFYHSMYVPYVKQRHLAMAEICSYSELFDIFSRGELILVRDQNHVIICAGLFEIQGHRVHCRKVGIRDGNWEYVREGAVGACYYFLMMEMKKRGHRRIHLGGARPLLSDGVTKFKTSLNAQLAGWQESDLVSLLLLRDSAGLQSFLIHHPFVCKDHADSLRAVIFLAEDQDNEAINEVVCSTVCHGLEDSHIFVFGGANERSNYYFSVKPAWPLFDHSMPLTTNKSLKISWIKRLVQRVSVAGG